MLCFIIYAIIYSCRQWRLIDSTCSRGNRDVSLFVWKWISAIVYEAGHVDGSPPPSSPSSSHSLPPSVHPPGGRVPGWFWDA